jgi:hypothetical protein
LNSNPKFDALLRGNLGVALDYRSLNFNGALYRVDYATELDDAAVACALDDAAVMGGYCRIDQIAAQSTKPRERAFFVGSSKPTVADDIRHQDCDKLAGLAHRRAQPPSTLCRLIFRSDCSFAATTSNFRAAPAPRPFPAFPA